MSIETPVAPIEPALEFHQMTVGQKCVFVLKVAAMFLTLGFAFPNILGDK